MSNVLDCPVGRQVLSLSPALRSLGEGGFFLLPCSTAHLLYEKNRPSRRFFSWRLYSSNRNRLCLPRSYRQTQ